MTPKETMLPSIHNSSYAAAVSGKEAVHSAAAKGNAVAHSKTDNGALQRETLVVTVNANEGPSVVDKKIRLDHSKGRDSAVQPDNELSLLGSFANSFLFSYAITDCEDFLKMQATGLASSLALFMASTHEKTWTPKTALHQITDWKHDVRQRRITRQEQPEGLHPTFEVFDSTLRSFFADIAIHTPDDLMDYRSLGRAYIDWRRKNNMKEIKAHTAYLYVGTWRRVVNRQLSSHDEHEVVGATKAQKGHKAVGGSASTNPRNPAKRKVPVKDYGPLKKPKHSGEEVPVLSLILPREASKTEETNAFKRRPTLQGNVFKTNTMAHGQYAVPVHESRKQSQAGRPDPEPGALGQIDYSFVGMPQPIAAVSAAYPYQTAATGERVPFRTGTYDDKGLSFNGYQPPFPGLQAPLSQLATYGATGGSSWENPAQAALLYGADHQGLLNQQQVLFQQAQLTGQYRYPAVTGQYSATAYGIPAAASIGTHYAPTNHPPTTVGPMVLLQPQQERERDIPLYFPPEKERPAHLSKLSVRSPERNHDQSSSYSNTGDEEDQDLSNEKENKPGVDKHNGQCWFPGCRSLAMADDRYRLTDLSIYLRKYFVEVFAATDTDVATPVHGRNTIITSRQVGVRCMYCKRKYLDVGLPRNRSIARV